MTNTVRLGEAYDNYRAGRWEKVESICQELIGIDPRSHGALNLLGVLALQGGDHRRAVEMISRAAREDPKNASYLVNLGEAFRVGGEPDKAIGHFERALSIDVDRADAYCAMGNVRLNKSRYDDALACYQRAIEIDPTYAQAHCNKGNVLCARGDIDAAITAFNHAIAANPTLMDAHFNLGNLLSMQGMLDDATAAYEKAVSIAPHFATAHHGLGKVLLRANRFGEAVEPLKRAIELGPDLLEPHNDLALCFLEQGENENALAPLRRMIEIDSACAEAHNNLGLALQRLSRLDDAIHHYEKALESNSDFAAARVNFGHCLCLLHRPGEAIAHLERAVVLDPGSADVMSNHGYALRHAGQLDAAAEAYQRALELDPEHLDASFGAATVLLGRGEFSRGWRHYLVRPSMRNVGSAFHRVPLESDLTGRRVLVVGDQGLGDELLFLRFLRELRRRGTWVAYLPDPRLADMLERAAVADRIVRRIEDVPDVDLRLSVGDLPFVLRMGNNTPPPSIRLVVSNACETAVAQRLRNLGASPVLGVTWRAGVPNRMRGQFREIPLDALAAALRGVDATIVGLQRNPRPGELDALADAIDRPVMDLTDLNDDLETMLALVQRLDEYVCVSDTNVALRAAVGKTCRILLPNPPDFRWTAGGAESPWFPGTRIYRQLPHGSWDPATDRLSSDLTGM